jgi:hypothetical protein
MTSTRTLAEGSAGAVVWADSWGFPQPDKIKAPKAESRNKKEEKKPTNDERCFGFRVSDLFRISDFGFRIWSVLFMGR